MPKKQNKVKTEVIKDAGQIQELQQMPIEDEVTKGDTEVLPEVENVTTEPVEALEEIIPEIPKREIRITGTNVNKLAKDLMYASALGAELVPKILPRISSLPYLVRLLIDEDKYEEWINRANQPQWDENTEYNRLVITSPTIMTFVKGLMEAGKRGAVLPDRLKVRFGSPYQAVLAIRNPIAETATISVGPKKITYTKEELEQYDIHDLKLIGSTLSLTGRSKAALIKAILDKQKGSEA